MEAIRSNSVTYTSDRNIKQTMKDNSTEMTLGGGAGVATFGTINQSSKIGNNVIKMVKSSNRIKADKQAKIINLLENSKYFAKFAKNPIVKKVAGGLAGLSAATALVGSTAKIADTGAFLTSLNTQA